MSDPAWWAPFTRRGRRPPLSGWDLPGDYSEPSWIPTPKWSGSAVDDNLPELLRLQRLTDAAPLIKHAFLKRYWDELDRRYRKLCFVRERAIARARVQLAEGRVPQRPARLRNAREAEMAAYRKLADRVRRFA